MWPAHHATLIDRCHAFGQPRPTPLLLRYRAGDYNCLHQDLYGPIHFPLQAVVMLSAEGSYTGGALTLVENRPRMQSRVEVVPICQGQIALIPVRDKPRIGATGWSKSAMRHGVSTVLSGERQTLGIIFHDAS
ncbi:2OG-Fe(II) oxygenase [Novosphingobium cyanobacteriorum]|uniref:2OG-Fe(II) oxygenase n=1 Tax=Novosphingobium cyanobacteriorum TaxID=3024215 RepID=A0ABT6CNC4_9SPHN|nr:2OG-Fe(II) oxygenase [Novosphingobium cyanobacteriorum]MDF8335407.1 2OG-Fe(II) oxygenase [Novosphingobium cyanobacteriorum]